MSEKPTYALTCLPSWNALLLLSQKQNGHYFCFHYHIFYSLNWSRSRSSCTKQSVQTVMFFDVNSYDAVHILTTLDTELKHIFALTEMAFARGRYCYPLLLLILWTLIEVWTQLGLRCMRSQGTSYPFCSCSLCGLLLRHKWKITQKKFSLPYRKSGNATATLWGLVQQFN